MWHPSFLECCAHPEYLGNCCSSIKVSLCITSSWRPSLRTSLQEVKLCFTAIPLVSRLWYFLSPLHWVTSSYSSQYPWHQAEAQDLVEWMILQSSSLFSLWTRTLSASPPPVYLPLVVGISSSLLTLTYLLSVFEENRFSQPGQCWSPIWHLWGSRSCVIDPRRWTVPLENPWEEDED